MQRLLIGLGAFILGVVLTIVVMVVWARTPDSTFIEVVVAPTDTPTPTATNTPTNTPTPTATPTNTPTPTYTNTSTNTPRPTRTPTQRRVLSTGNWDIIYSNSDPNRVSLQLDADDVVVGPTNSEIPALIIRCDQKATDIYVYVGMPVEADDDGVTKYTIKVDTYKALDFTGTTSTDGDAIFLTDDRETAFTFIMLLKSTRKLTFTFKPPKSKALEASFNVRGLSNAIEQTEQNCGWETIE